MKINKVTIRVSQDEILARIAHIQASGSDPFGEYIPALIAFLDYEHAKPFLKEETTEEAWIAAGPHGDKELRGDIKHYLDWWGQKVEDGRGLSVHRGRAQMINRLFLAGIPLWKEIGLNSNEGINGGWYQEDAYNKVADLFEVPHKYGLSSA